MPRRRQPKTNHRECTPQEAALLIGVEIAAGGGPTLEELAQLVGRHPETIYRFLLRQRWCGITAVDGRYYLRAIVDEDARAVQRLRKPKRQMCDPVLLLIEADD